MEMQEAYARADLARLEHCRDALIVIQTLMSGREWSADTLDAIALVLENAGFTLQPYEG